MRVITRKALKVVAEAAVKRIVERTQSGLDIDGKPFAPYTPAYRDLKAGSGRPVNPPNLTASGDLLRLMRVLRLEDGRVVIGWKRQPHRQFLFEKRGRTRAVLDPHQGLFPRRAIVGPVQHTPLPGRKRPQALFITKTKLRLQRDGKEAQIEDIVKGLQHKRPFFGVGKEDTAELAKLFKAEVSKGVRAFLGKGG